MELKLEAIAKSFGGVLALKGVHLKAHSGEVHALVGENGAGKSTLMKILSGVIPHGSYEGRFLFDGVEQSFSNPKAAEMAGVSIIHQELSAFPHLSVAENLFVGRWPKRSGCVDSEKMFAQAQVALERVGATFSADTLMQSLSTGDQQMVEIAKALLRDSRILILDEPTSSLSPKECTRLFTLISDLAKAGKTLFYISHRMEEIFSLSHRVTVLRDGASVKSCLTTEITESDLVKAMVGRDMGAHYPPRPERKLDKHILKVENFSALKKSGGSLGPLSFEAKAGEIIGFGGLLGSGRTEILRALLGDEGYKCHGIAMIGDKPLSSQIRSTLSQGIGALSEDRKRESILPSLSLVDNFSVQKNGLGSLWALVNPQKEEASTKIALDHLRTRFQNPDQKITALSGGNQQKVILARILDSNPQLLILDEPTRGVDVGAKYEIYEILFSLAAAGKTILLVSSDLPELLALSDRILVMAKGKVTGELKRSQFSQEAVMRLAVQ